MKLIFMGTPAYARRILEEILAEEDAGGNAGGNFELLALYTQPARPAGRGGRLKMSETEEYLRAERPGLLILTPGSLRGEEGRVEAERIVQFKPDFIVVAAYAQLLPPQILKIAPCINLHASILPRWRGASPVQAAILAGDESSGVSAMLMDEGLDTGAVLASEACEIAWLNAPQVLERLGELAARICVRVLKTFHALPPQPQNHAAATHCKKIKKEQGRIDLTDAGEIYRKFLAFTPWPGIFLPGVKFLDLDLLAEGGANEPGRILKIEGEAFILGCKRGSLRIKGLQEPGKRPVSGRAYLNGKRLRVGDRLPGVGGSQDEDENGGRG